MNPDKLGIVFFPAFDWCIAPTHPEREERLVYTLDQLQEEGLFDLPGISLHNPKQATLEDIARVHFCLPDAASQCPAAHRIAAGGAITAGQLVMEKKAEKAFALVRPPGHHAMRVVSGGRGFCQVNIEAIMLERLRKDHGPLRVAIIDTDCHHGDGTQDIYWHDKDTLFISIHQDGRTLYPGTGFADELGGPNARGRTLNVPLPPGSGDAAFLYVVDNLVLPVLADFKPDLIINSAGQDNHFTDPITSMRLSAQGYAALNEKLSPHIAVLEGGYSVQGALPYVNLGICLAMAGYDYSDVYEPDYDRFYIGGGDGVERAKQLTEELLREYHTPSEALPSGGAEKDGMFISERDVYYDTNGVREHRRDMVALCDACAGALFIEAVSSVCAPVACVYTPRNACPSCIAKAEALADEAKNNPNYDSVMVTNRVQDTTACFGRNS